LIDSVGNATKVVDDFQAIITNDVDVAGFKIKMKVVLFACHRVPALAPIIPHTVLPDCLPRTPEQPALQ
jgi:hypothetical protein